MAASAVQAPREFSSPPNTCVESGASLHVVVRKLADWEVEELRVGATVAHLASVDDAGFPHITPLWFIWSNGLYRITSVTTRPHVQRIARNRQVGLGIDIEEPLRADGERPNKQLRIIGTATVSPDHDNLWTARIRDKYIGPGHRMRDDEPPRTLVTVTPASHTAVASV